MQPEEQMPPQASVPNATGGRRRFRTEPVFVQLHRCGLETASTGNVYILFDCTILSVLSVEKFVVK